MTSNALGSIVHDVIRNRLVAITEEMRIALQSVSGSPTVTEASDFFTGLFLHQTMQCQAHFTFSSLRHRHLTPESLTHTFGFQLHGRRCINTRRQRRRMHIAVRLAPTSLTRAAPRPPRTLATPWRASARTRSRRC